MESIFKSGKTQRVQRTWVVFALIAAVFAGKPAFSQTFPLQVQVSVMPPYSAYLQDYPGAGQQVRVFIINTSRSTYQVRLAGQLTSDNGIEVRTSPSYRPPRPLTVPPGQTLLSRTDLEGLFDLNQIEVTGIDKNLLARGFPLPDGTYQLCVRAFNETATNTAAVAFGQPLSSEFPLGCSAPIVVRSVEPPILIAPLCDAAVTATTPQAVVFTWTPPAGVSPAQVDYTLRIIELPQTDVDPNVFIDAVALPKSGVEVRNLRTSTFLYGPTQPPLQLGKRYAWRVQAIDRLGKLNFQNDGKSPVCAFTYGIVPKALIKPGLELVQTPAKILPIPGLGGQLATIPSDSAKPGAIAPKPLKVAQANVFCKSVELPDEQGPQSGALAGKTVKLGEFDLTIATATFANSSYNGDGRVTWNGAPIKVKFTGLKVNGQNQVFDGNVVSDSKGPGAPNIPLGQIDGYGGLPSNYFEQIKTTLLDAAKQAVALPLPLKYDGKLGTVGINQMSFSPVGAKMDLVMGVSLPEANLTLFLAAVDVCTSPQKKLPNTGTLYLIKDLPMPIPGGIGQKFVFKKSDPTSGKPDGTYASITNGDFDKVHGVLDLNLGSTILKADDGKGAVKPGDLVGTITADFVQWSDWVGTVLLPPFQVPGLSGVTFMGNDIVYDHSDKANPDGFSLPKEYNGDTGPTFHGTYFKKVTVELPKSFRDNPRIGVSVNGGILDGSGFTGLIASANTPVLDYTKGSLAGFGFGIDDIQWTIVQNSNRGGNILGKLQFPISTDAFSYSCSLSGGFDKVQFTASPKDGYTVPLFAATMDLNANTAISVIYTSGQKTQISMSLGGQLAIDVKKFAGSGGVGKAIDTVVPKLYFEKFTISNTSTPGTTALGGSGLYLNTGTWQLKNDVAPSNNPPAENPEKSSGPWLPDNEFYEWTMAPSDDDKPSLAGFPLDFDTPTVVSAKEGTGVRLGIGMHLGEGADDTKFVQAHGTLDILGSVTSDGNRFTPAFTGVYPRNINVAGSIGPLTVKGDLDFINGNATYGSGIKGNATVQIPGFDVKIKMMMLFGNVNGFKYGFVDGSVQFPAGVPIVGPIVLTGLGGGMHYNMGMMVGGQNTQTNPDQVTKLAKATASNDDAPKPVDLTNPGQSLSGAVFKPEKSNWGFTAKIYAGLVDPHVFNSSLAMTISFAGGTMGGINLHGNANVISTSGDGDGKDGMVNASMDITYAQGILDASLAVKAKFLTVTAQIPFSMHVAGKNDWFVKVGKPENEFDRIQITLFDLNAGPLQAYLAAKGYVATGVGPSLQLPPVPSNVDDFLRNSGNTLPEAKTAYQKRAKPNLMPIGNEYKLLFGGRLDGNLKVQVQPFRLWANATVGFDIALLKNMTCAGSNEKPTGINGWYGQGQAYAYFGGGIDIYVDVWFFEGSVNIMTLQAGALLTAGLPDPTWADGRVKVKGEALGGLISVETTQDFSFGSKCVPVYNGDPLKDIIIISEMTPANGETDISNLPTVAVAFNVPINKEFPIYITSDDVRTYIFKAESPEFLAKPKGGSFSPVADLKPIQWSSDQKSYLQSASAYLPSYATCQLTQQVIVKEKVSGAWNDPLNIDTGQREPRSQSKTTTFTLGKQPDEIPLESITGTWPIEGQNYFLKNQFPKGFLRGTFKGLECLSVSTGSQLVATFKGTDGIVSQPVQFNTVDLISFDIPAGLKNSRKYQMEISRQAVAPNKGSSTASSLTTSKYVTLAQSPKLQFYQTTLDKNAVQAMAAVQQANKGKTVFELNFYTSKYNTFAQKLAGLDFRASDYQDDHTIRLAPASVSDQERFDRFELFSNQTVPGYKNFKLGAAFLNVETPIDNTPYDDEITKKVYWKFRRLTEDGAGSYASAGAGQGQGDDFKTETLGQYNLYDDPYDRESYAGITDYTVSGQPRRTLFFGPKKASYSPYGTNMYFDFVRDKLALDDMIALGGIFDGLTKLNRADVRAGKKYSPDKNMSDQAYMAKYVHDPNAESVGIYKQGIYSPYWKQNIANKEYKKIDQVTYNEYDQIIASSPSMTLYILDFTGKFYRKEQYWQFAEDKYYQPVAYYDQKDEYHSGAAERGKNSPFTVVFRYGSDKEASWPTKTITKKYTIGSVNEASQVKFPLVGIPVFYYLP